MSPPNRFQGHSAVLSAAVMQLYLKNLTNPNNDLKHVFYSPFLLLGRFGRRFQPFFRLTGQTPDTTRHQDSYIICLLFAERQAQNPFRTIHAHSAPAWHVK